MKTEIEPFKLKLLENQKEDEKQDMKTCHTSYKNSIAYPWDFDNSFMYADIEIEDKRELERSERRISERINRKSNKTYASNFQTVFGKYKSYGWHCGKSTNPDLDWWVKAEEWLKFAFQGSSKSFSKKDRKVFQELIETEVKKESKVEVENDHRIPLTGNLIVLIIIACIENDLKRTFPHDEYYQSSEAK